MITDVPVTTTDTRRKTMTAFNGYVTMEYALEHSLNIPAVKSLRALGKDKLIRKLTDCDFRQVTGTEKA